MIWDSILLMTIFDVIIIGLTVFALWNFLKQSQLLKQLKVLYGLYLIFVGLSIFALFYFLDFITMHLFPLFLPMKQAMMIMEGLHLNYNWIVSLFGVISIVIGLVYLIRILFPKISTVIKTLEQTQGDLKKEINERKEVEAALRESEEQHRNLVEGSADAIISTDEKMKIIHWNNAATRIFGYSAAEAMGNPVEMVVPEKHQQDHREGVNRFLETGNGPIIGKTVEVEGIRKDGTNVPIEISLSALRQKESWMFTAIIRDIHDRKDAETALRASEEKHRTTLDANPDPVVVYDMVGKVEYLNPAFTNVFGWTPEETVGKKIDNFVPEENWPETKMMIEKVIAGEPFSGNETVRFRKSGDRIHVSLSASPLKDPHGNVISSVVNLRDISDRKEIEAALQKSKHEAEMANRAKSEFLANMSHEIRTPMNAVIGFTDFLLDTDLDDSQKDYSRTIKSSSNALLSVINDILDFSKVESGEMDFEEIDFDPEILAYDVCDVIRPRIGAKPVEIICHIGDALPALVKGDPGRFRQVLTNLMGNSSKFTEEGEIELSLDIDEENADRVNLHARVKDTGIGIPEDKLKTIFEPFHQADSSTTRRYGGTGLGLSICRKISNLMQGDVWAESQDGGGTTFHFTAWLKKVEKKRIKRLAPVSLSGKKVLVVDDNQRNLEILSQILQKAGMSVVALKKGRDTVSTLEMDLNSQNPYAVCIMDIQMPGMSGYEIAGQIRDSKTDIRHLPMIALSSLMEREAKKCNEAGFDGFLSKPIRREKLYRMLERILVEKTAEKEKFEAVEPKILTQYSVLEEIKHSVRILLAEDNPVNQKLAQMMLTKAGYQVDVVENGKEAFEKYIENPSDFDLILMDVQMPEMGGLEATRVIRDRGFDTIPIIAMTAHAMKGDRQTCIEAGMDDYISKPIKREIVFEILEKWVFK